VQAGLDVQTSAVCIAVLWFWLDGILPKLLVVILYFGSGLTEFCWAFSCYLVLLFLYWASVPGWTNNNALPAQSPGRWQQLTSLIVSVRVFLGTAFCLGSSIGLNRLVKGLWFFNKNLTIYFGIQFYYTSFWLDTLYMFSRN
jgi:hypothetical protein